MREKRHQFGAGPGAELVVDTADDSRRVCIEMPRSAAMARSPDYQTPMFTINATLPIAFDGYGSSRSMCCVLRACYPLVKEGSAGG